MTGSREYFHYSARPTTWFMKKVTEVNRHFRWNLADKTLPLILNALGTGYIIHLQFNKILGCDIYLYPINKHASQPPV